MDFDPNPPTGERNRSGPRWYSVVAFLVIASLLALIAIGVLISSAANEERACYAKWTAEAETIQASDLTIQGQEPFRERIVRMREDCQPGSTGKR